VVNHKFDEEDATRREKGARSRNRDSKNEENALQTRPWFRPSQPFLVHQEIDKYPALDGLNPAALANKFGNTTVWVSESGKEQRHVRWLQTTLRSYLEAQPNGFQDGVPVPFYLSENETLVERWGLLPSLREYVRHLVPRPALLFERSAAWLGHRGTRTGLHADPDGFNLLCQIWGSKRVWLFDAYAARPIVRSPRFDGGARTTEIDFWTTTIPTLSQAREKSVVLRPGDILYVPRWQWHAAENLETSLAFSYRSETPVSLLLNLPVEGRHLLHNLGLYRKHNCTCHPTLSEAILQS
jgi:hypothetical protein